MNILPDGEMGILADVIDVYYMDNYNVDASGKISSIGGMTKAGTLADVVTKKVSSEGKLLPKDAANSGETIVAIAMNMQESADNRYQGKSIGTTFSIEFLATQLAYEEDAFGPEYDKDSDYTVFEGDFVVSSAVSVNENNEVVNDTVFASDNNEVTFNVGAGSKVKEGVDRLTGTVTVLDETAGNMVATENEILIPVDVHVEGLAPDNTVPVVVTMDGFFDPGLNKGNYTLGHVENGTTNVMVGVNSIAELDAHNEYYYDPATGTVSVALCTFSEVVAVRNVESVWEGNFDYSWYANAVAPIAEGEPDYVIANADQLAAFGAIVGGMNGQTQDSFAGKTVKLLADIDLGDKDNANGSLIFHPIGYYYTADKNEDGTTGDYYSTVYSFEGTFDGNGNTIANFYHNTWEIKGDYDGNYYDVAMGLFGYVVNGTVKNLTVDNFSSDGEFTPTGVIAAYAVNSTFENIAITNCNPRVYNTGNGGIVGIGGNSDDPDTYELTFTNITIDNSNKITALWGSWDVACGGLVGMFRGAGHVNMTNCHVAAQIDVYNDVCGNYQYYWYRYSGMMIGTNKNMITDKDGYTVPETSKFHAEDCTVHFGDWNDYYYCELVANSLASYTHDHQFSRLTQIQNVSEIQDANGNWTTTGNFIVMNGKTPTETCYHIVKSADGTLKQHNHSDAGEETVNGETVLKENNQRIFLPFNQLFTGYGWGVKHIPVYNGEDYAFEGITILDRKEADSVVKFAGKVSELIATKTYKLGDIFSFIDNNVELVPGALTVSIVNLDENNPVSATIVYDRDNWEDSTITFTGVGQIQITIQDYYFCTPTTINVTIKDREPEVKFDVVMNNGDFLHRVGNVETVALDKLFKAKDGVTIGTVSVTVEAVDDTVASGTYTNNAIQFNGTGVVKVTITDNDYCIPTELLLEVVDAVNATGAMSATSNNVVLLNDCSLSDFTVSGGYYFYGNGFELSRSDDQVALSRDYAWVTLDNGTLDNVQIIAPNMNYSILFDENKKDSGNNKVTDSNGTTRYYNIKSAVIAKNNSSILNSHISGGRAAVYAAGGTILIGNTTITGGAAANIHLTSSVNNITLRDVTLIQKPILSSDGTKTLMGLSVAVMAAADKTVAPIVLEGYLNQYAWATEDDKQYVPSDYQKFVDTALSTSGFVHTINGKSAINLGFICVPEAYSLPDKLIVDDNRSNKDTIPYDHKTVSTSPIYSIITNNYDGSISEQPSDYSPNKQDSYMPKFDFADIQGEVIKVTTLFDGGRWVNTLTVDLDNIAGNSYLFDFNNIKIVKHGKELSFAVKDAQGNAVDKSTKITLNSLFDSEYVLVVTDNQIYDSNGNLTNLTVTRELVFKLVTVKTSIPDPTISYISDEFTGLTHGRLRLSDTETGDWRPTANALAGVKITYWDGSKTVELDLGKLDLSSGEYTINDNVWTFTCAAFTLKLTGKEIKTGYTITPIVTKAVDNTNKLFYCSTKVAYGTTPANDNRAFYIDYELQVIMLQLNGKDVKRLIIVV